LIVIIIPLRARGAGSADRASAPAKAATLSPFRDRAARRRRRLRRRRRSRGSTRRRSSTTSRSFRRTSRQGSRAPVTPGSGSSSEDGADGGPGGLLAHVLVVEEGVALAGEDAGDPRVLVREVPDRHADARLLGHAGARHGREVLGLLLQARRAGRQRREPDVQLRVRDLGRAGRDVRLHGGLERGLRGRAADDQMRLHAHAVDACAGVLDEGDDACGALLLGTRVLDVVVVVVQLGVGIGRSRGFKGDGDVLFSYHVVEDILPVGSVFVERLVHYVPGVAFALVVSHHVRDVRVDYRG
jgi:hypothetical protein